MVTFLRNLALLIFLSTARQALCLNHVNTQPAVAEFLTGTAQRPVEQWIGVFEILENSFPEFYSNIVFRIKEDGWRERKQRYLKHLFFNLPSSRQKISKINEEQSVLIKASEKSFYRVLPEAKLDVDVYFLPGLAFNGKVEKLSPSAPKPSLFVGIDMVAERNDNVSVLMAHELFHVHHFKVAQFENTMTSSLWIEGLATFASGEISGEFALKALLMDAKLSEACDDFKTVQVWINEFKRVAKLSGDDTSANKIYADWFLLSGSGEIKRRGYCIGLQIARKIAKKGFSISDMSKWNYSKFSEQIETVMTEYE